MHLAVNGYLPLCGQQQWVETRTTQGWERVSSPAMGIGDRLDDQLWQWPVCDHVVCTPVDEVSWPLNRIAQVASRTYRTVALQGRLRLHVTLHRDAGCGGMERTITLEGAGHRWRVL